MSTSSLLNRVVFDLTETISSIFILLILDGCRPKTVTFFSGYTFLLELSLSSICSEFSFLSFFRVTKVHLDERRLH